MVVELALLVTPPGMLYRLLGPPGAPASGCVAGCHPSCAPPPFIQCRLGGIRWPGRCARDRRSRVCQPSRCWRRQGRISPGAPIPLFLASVFRRCIPVPWALLLTLFLDRQAATTQTCTKNIAEEPQANSVESQVRRQRYYRSVSCDGYQAVHPATR
ncbi:hypothetical protein BKA82DRAFT_750649 [Pisolithus tinctorius]|uniref:Uncharacterized protein n=1 Tax=Pisolithus tinctorius Marx 270 TaxID=870435 RepID=A0A0C3KRS4_PISTI|nr:hypothetical protein BKA82DRAFT_750649 [Pisolithus tinctorius]KIO12242.1 hypothetical protein M404DRAFT_750649 [Pisolithus tinctorius Marx 270]